jgi:putative acetyltransferase
MHIRKALDRDLEAVLTVERAAFDTDEEANLVRDLLSDSSAMPAVSLLAFVEDRPVGHILFTRARLEPQTPPSIALLAPLAVVPASQRRGIGGALIEHGMGLLEEAGTDLVFVLGYPDYYSRHGFQPAGPLGFEATYPIAEEHADAWMVRPLRADAMDAYRGRVVCADALQDPKYWRE